MMPDIFSIFDPATNLVFNAMPLSYWFLVFFPMYVLAPINFRITVPNPRIVLVFKFMTLMLDQANQTLSTHLKLFPTLLAMMFIWLGAINLGTMLPYSANPSSHLAFTIPLGLSCWLALILSSIPSYKVFLAGLLPAGSPNWLAPALVLIETASILFRPITLCFRLAANMSAGHIIFSLLASYMMGAALAAAKLSLTLFLLTLSGYCIFEFGICVIQAYIFCLLLSLYANEHPMP